MAILAEIKITAILLLALLFLKTGYISAGQVQAEISILHKTIANAKPAFSTEQAKHYATELIPLIENASEKRFKSVPEIRLVTAEEL